MQISGLYSADLQNGLGVGVTLGTAGCRKRCKGCFNSKFWMLNSGIKYTKVHKEQILKLVSKDYIDHFSVIGGEPLLSENLYELNDLIDSIRKVKPNISIWIWTGYTLDELLQTSSSVSNAVLQVLGKIDYLVDGPFVQELSDKNLLWRGSSNQRIIDIAATLKQYGNLYNPIVIS